MKQPCAGCGGSGQIGSFLGVSRFLLTWEECPVCSGTGIVEMVAGEAPVQEKGRGQDGAPGRGRKKRGK